MVEYGDNIKDIPNITRARERSKLPPRSELERAAAKAESAQLNLEKRALLIKSMAELGDLPSFAQYVLGLPPAPHHYIWYEAMADMDIRELSLICPPGHGKTVCTQIYLGWDLALDNNLTVAYVSHKDPEARKTSLALRDLIGGEGDSGRRYREIIDSPNSVYQKTQMGGKWAEGFWTLDREEFLKDPTFQCTGDKCSVLGSRLKRICIDDINDPENTATAELRAQLNFRVSSVLLSRQWLNTVEGRDRRPTDRGRVLDSRTRWAEDDSFSVLVSRFPDLKIIHMPAIGYWELLVAQVMGEDTSEIFPAWVNNYIPKGISRDYLVQLKDWYRGLFRRSKIIPSTVKGRDLAVKALEDKVCNSSNFNYIHRILGVWEE